MYHTLEVVSDYHIFLCPLSFAHFLFMTQYLSSHLLYQGQYKKTLSLSSTVCAPASCSCWCYYMEQPWLMEYDVKIVNPMWGLRSSTITIFHLRFWYYYWCPQSLEVELKFLQEALLFLSNDHGLILYLFQFPELGCFLFFLRNYIPSYSSRDFDMTLDCCSIKLCARLEFVLIFSIEWLYQWSNSLLLSFELFIMCTHISHAYMSLDNASKTMQHFSGTENFFLVTLIYLRVTQCTIWQ